MSAPTKRGLTTAQSYLLNQACRPVRRAFGCSGPYLVGTAATGSDYRDVDVRVILHDDDFDALFGERERLWDLLCMSVSLYLSNATGLPVDFQVQRMTEANERYDGPRQALGINASPADRFAGGGDATPDHDLRCIRLTGAEDVREFCDCRTWRMLDRAASQDPPSAANDMAERPAHKSAQASPDGAE